MMLISTKVLKQSNLEKITDVVKVYVSDSLLEPLDRSPVSKQEMLESWHRAPFYPCGNKKANMVGTFSVTKKERKKEELRSFGPT
jgi:hypothetical protein